MLLIAPSLAWVFATAAASADTYVANDGSGAISLGEGCAGDERPEAEHLCNIGECKFTLLIVIHWVHLLYVIVG